MLPDFNFSTINILAKSKKLINLVTRITMNRRRLPSTLFHIITFVVRSCRGAQPSWGKCCGRFVSFLRSFFQQVGGNKFSQQFLETWIFLLSWHKLGKSLESWWIKICECCNMQLFSNDVEWFIALYFFKYQLLLPSPLCFPRTFRTKLTLTTNTS